MNDTDIEELRRHYRTEAIKAVRVAEQRIREELSYTYSEQIRSPIVSGHAKDNWFFIFYRALTLNKEKVKSDARKSQPVEPVDKRIILDIIKVSMEEVMFEDIVQSFHYLSAVCIDLPGYKARVWGRPWCTGNYATH